MEGAAFIAVAAALVLFNHQYVEPYGTFTGQLVLAVVVAMFALSVLWLRRLAGVAEPERFLVSDRVDRVAERGTERIVEHAAQRAAPHAAGGGR